MRIGELAEAVGCHVETVRYYEKVGLIPASGRAANGYGVYSDEHLQCLRLIRRARSLGFSQSEVHELVGLIGARNNSCEMVRDIVDKQVAVVDQKLAELRGMKKTLVQLLASCEEGTQDDCPALAELLHG